MRLRLDYGVPRPARHDRTLVRLSPDGSGALALVPVFDAAEATHQIVDAAGSPLLTHLTERDAVISGEIMRGNIWEFAESLALLLSARPGMTVVDAGANVGYCSVLLARVLERTGRIFAFEPAPDNYFILEANALLTQQLWPGAAPIAAFRLALADKPGTATLHLFDWNLGLHSLVHGGAEAGRSVAVEAVTLDSLRFPDDGGSPAIDRRIDLIKADTQGSELPILRGAERTLERDRPLLCLECEPYLSGDDECLALVRWLHDHGYQRFRVFHADGQDPYQTVVEFAAVLTVEQVADRVRRKAIGPYGTLLAFPGVTAGP
jgi:FkbM family methyltransferase